MAWVRAHPRAEYTLRILVVAALYYGAAKAGLAFTAAHSPVSAVWPPTGLALVAIVLGGYRLAPGVALGAFLIETGTAPLGAAVGMTIGNTLEAVAGAYLLGRLGFEPSMKRVRDVLALLLVSVAATTVSATIGVFSLWAAGVIPGSGFGFSWRLWWAGDLGGALVVAPALFVLASRPQLPPGRRAYLAELAVLLLLLAAATGYVFTHHQPLAYVVTVLLLWTALRCGQLGAVLGTLTVASIATYFTMRHQGLFAVMTVKDVGLIRIQAFAGVSTVAALLVAAVRSEGRDVRESLQLLRQREHQLAEAQQLAHIGSWEWDIPTNAVTWSDELYRIYGVTHADLAPSYEGWLQMVHPRDRDFANGVVQKAFASCSDFHYTHRLIRPDGEVRILEAFGHVVTGPDGKPLKMFGTAQDVTELRSAESRFRQLLDLAPDAIIGVGADGRIELASEQTEKLFGYDREELMGQRLELLVPDRFREDHAGNRADYFANPKARPMGAGLELFARRKDGSEFPCEISLSSIQSDGRAMAIAAVRDISERKRIEAEADRLKSEFFALVSHELRTPLTSIVGYLDVLSEKEKERFTSDGREYVDVVVRNAQRLDRLVQDLLLITQLEAGSFEIEVGEVDMAKIANMVAEEQRWAAERGEVQLEVKAGDLPMVSGDSDRLTQVLDNLVSNAIKFTPPGGRIEVRVVAEREACVVEVQDTGVGIAPQELEHLFDRFYRAPTATREQIKGVGLGLAITEAIVNSHNGKIEIESEVGVGSIFRVLLPMKGYDNARPGREKAEVS
jgi:protein-histidine pros-kinase